jgi:hypothetical protein
MADYFTNFSLILQLPAEAARKYALDLAHQAACIHQGDDIPDGFPASLREVLEDWQFETDAADPSDGWGLWLHSENGGVDAVCAFVQHLLQRFDPCGSAAVEWSNDCSKPRVDAYGGGAALVTATKIKGINTGQWLQRQLARLHTHNSGRHSPA